MSVWAERLRSTSEQQLLILGGAIGVTALCDLLAIDAMLGTFTCGAILANASTRDRDLLASVRQLDYPLYVLFFAQPEPIYTSKCCLKLALLAQRMSCCEPPANW